MQKTNKEMLAISINKKHDIPKAKAKRIVNDIFDEISEVIANEGKATISGFGSFGQKIRKERKGFNVSKRKFTTIKECKLPTFKPSPKLKERLEK